MPKQCCGTSVGVLICDDGTIGEERMLMITRNTAPAGIAPVAGHALDEHEGYADAARAEVAEEIGLEVSSLNRLNVGGHHPGRCRRIPHNGGGHDWEVFAARVRGDLHLSEREVADVGWYTREQIQDLAERTAHYTRWGDEETWLANPGLEPVWCEWMAQLGIVHLDEADLARIRRVAATPPVANL